MLKLFISTYRGEYYTTSFLIKEHETNHPVQIIVGYEDQSKIETMKSKITEKILNANFEIVEQGNIEKHKSFDDYEKTKQVQLSEFGNEWRF